MALNVNLRADFSSLNDRIVVGGVGSAKCADDVHSVSASVRKRRSSNSAGNKRRELNKCLRFRDGDLLAADTMRVTLVQNESETLCGLVARERERSVREKYTGPIVHVATDRRMVVFRHECTVYGARLSSCGQKGGASIFRM